ncbi:MAG: hypothetical protein KTR26_14245 [Flammeovirgaceae bacterium]|nr:hypothetical protein [Flammeovirgaceae bacterium]
MKFYFLRCLIFSILINFLSSNSGTCQETKNYFSISFAPQYLLIEAIRIDLEKEINGGKNRIVVAPYFYYGTTDKYADQPNLNNSLINSTNTYQDDEVSGLGLESLYKFIMVPHENASPYLAAGLGYHHIRLKYLGTNWEPVERDGLEYLELTEANQEEIINRLDIIGLIGYRQSFQNGFLFDFFMGPVLKNSNIKNTHNFARVQDNPLYHYGYNGITLRIGFSLGVKF